MRVYTSALIRALAVVAAFSAPLEAGSEAGASDSSRSKSGDFQAPPMLNGNATVAVGVNKSRVLDRPSGIRRLSITNGEIAEAVAVSSTEVLINGKTPGETSMIIWGANGERSELEVHVEARNPKLEAMRAELEREVGPDVTASADGDTIFLRGTVRDIVTADRAATIASVAGKVVNLLRVEVPEAEPQILLKVRFATVSRTATQQLGFNFFAADQKGVGSVTTGQFGQYPSGTLAPNTPVTFTNLMNIFYFRPDLNMAALIQALEAKGLLQILAEPNLLTVAGRPASFLAGGEYPFPTLQGGGSGVGQITIQFKEFGIKLGFFPTITARGTIRLQVTPEVSSLDYTNGLTSGGFTVPGLATRRVETEVELKDGQSFVIAGLLDKQVTEQFNKLPGLANIPILGKLFESRSLVKNDTELMVLVTPELVGPLPADGKVPEIAMPLRFTTDAPLTAPRTPGAAQVGPVAPVKKLESVPVEQLPSVVPPTSMSPPQVPVQSAPVTTTGGQPPVDRAPLLPNASPPQGGSR